MQKNESEQQNIEKTEEFIIEEQEDKDNQAQQKKNSIQIESGNSSPSRSESLNSQKQQPQVKIQIPDKQTKPESSLQKNTIQSPVKRQLIRSQTKINEKVKITPGKTGQKFQNYSKQKLQDEAVSNSKLLSASHMKSSVKSNQKFKKINKPFYEETFYITGMKENYLLLLSDTNQVLQFPIGMFTTQTQISEHQNRSEQGSNTNENFHLIKDIKIGQPIKIKLELDFLRQQKDDRIFNSLQRTINEDYSYGNQETGNGRNKQMSIRKSK